LAKEKAKALLEEAEAKKIGKQAEKDEMIARI